MKARPSHAKARQASKIREIGDTLIALGYLALDEQAKALGLARSTAWTILQAITIALVSRQRSSTACWQPHSFLHSSAPLFLNTSMKKSPDYMATASCN